MLSTLSVFVRLKTKDRQKQKEEKSREDRRKGGNQTGSNKEARTHLYTLWFLIQHNAGFASIWPFGIRQHCLEHITAHAQNESVSMKQTHSDLQLDITEVSLSVQLKEFLESCPRVVYLLPTCRHPHGSVTSPLGSIVFWSSHVAGLSSFNDPIHCLKKTKQIHFFSSILHSFIFHFFPFFLSSSFMNKVHYVQRHCYPDMWSHKVCTLNTKNGGGYWVGLLFILFR